MDEKDERRARWLAKQAAEDKKRRFENAKRHEGKRFERERNEHEEIAL